MTERRDHEFGGRRFGYSHECEDQGSVRRVAPARRHSVKGQGSPAGPV